MVCTVVFTNISKNRTKVRSSCCTYPDRTCLSEFAAWETNAKHMASNNQHIVTFMIPICILLYPFGDFLYLYTAADFRASICWKHYYVRLLFGCRPMKAFAAASASAGLKAFSSFEVSLSPGPSGVQCIKVGMPLICKFSSVLKGCCGSFHAGRGPT